MNEPRHVQLLILAGFWGYGTAWLDFPGPGWTAPVYLTVALTTQWLFCRGLGLAFDWRSPLISALSLTLLLHADSVPWAVLAAVVAIAGKFLLRIDGRHLFNPSNLAIVTTVSLTDRVWVSPGQWGLEPFLALAAILAGVTVLRRIRRSEVTWTFLIAWAGLLFGRAFWLGDPLAIPWLHLQNVSLLIFAFFMLADPMTVPDHRVARIGFAVLVALVGHVLQYHFYVNEGLFYALALCAPLVPWFNRHLPGARYHWPLSASPGR